MTEPRDPAVRELEGYDGHLIDNLLSIAASEAGGSMADEIRVLQLGIRSERPQFMFAWTPKLDEQLSALLGRILPEPVARALGACKSVVSGERAALSVGRDWSELKQVRTPLSIELAQFRTTDSFSKVSERFKHHLDKDEPLDVVLRGHLWIGASISGLLDRKFVRPDEVSDARLSFNQTLSVASALGLVRSDEAAAIRKVNKLRNRAAHRLDAEVTETDQSELLGACSNRLRQIAGVDLKPFPFPSGIAQMVATLVIILHKRADEMDAASRYDLFLHEHVQDLLGGSKGQAT